METIRHEAYKITQWMDWIKASVFALITLRWSSKRSSVCNGVQGWRCNESDVVLDAVDLQGPDEPVVIDDPVVTVGL
jgi:hypothetical protein